MKTKLLILFLVLFTLSGCANSGLSNSDIMLKEAVQIATDMGREAVGTFSFVSVEQIDNEKCIVVMDIGSVNKSIYLYETGADKLSPTGIEGISEQFDYEIVETSQGVFVGVYTCTSMGNGSYNLYWAEDFSLAYSFDDIVDIHFECRQLSELDRSYWSEDIDKSDATVEISKIYSDGKLIAYFEDINLDGNTDIFFKGIVEYHIGEPDGETYLAKEEIIKKVFLYASTSDEFLSVE